MLLLWVVETDFRTKCPMRQQVCQLLLSTSDCCLQGKTSDFAVKVKNAYRNDLEKAAVDGLCSLPLFIFMLMVRAKLPSHNQDVEGMMSILQAMAKAAPRMGQGLACDRLCLKKGDQYPASVLSSMHEAVVQQMESVEHTNRFHNCFFY